MRRSQKSTLTGVLLSQLSPSNTYDKAARTGNYQQVFRLRLKKIDVCTLVILVLVLCVNFSVAYPKPKIVAHEGDTGEVYFKIPRCKTVPEEDLQKRLGPFFDGSRMAASLKLNSASDGEYTDEDMDDMQGDDADAYADDVMDEEEEEDYDDEEESEDGVDYSDKSETYKYMRKRRDLPDDDSPHRESQTNKRAASSSYGNLHLRLLLGRKNNNLTKEEKARNRKQLKKDLRRKLRKSKIPPWNCKVVFAEVDMPDGTFPAKITDGKCVTDKCFYRIYNCAPKKYRIKVLQRDPESCYPVPHIGLNTTYEEKWIFKTHRVTVGCNCERRRQKKPRRH